MPQSLLIESLSVELGGKETIEQPINLYQPYEAEQILLPDHANCLAVQAYLKMCDIDFKVENRWNTEYMSPSNKIPFIKCDSYVVSDFENIVTFLSNRGASLSFNMDQDDKVNLRAYASLVNNVLYNAELYICWCNDYTYNNVTKQRHGSVYPWPLNHMVNWQKRSQVKKKLAAIGWANKSTNEVLGEVKKCCEALSARLEDKLYFFGNSPSELDALVFGHIFSLVTTQLKDNALANIVKNYPRLINLTKNIENKYFRRDDHEKN